MSMTSSINITEALKYEPSEALLLEVWSCGYAQGVEEALRGLPHPSQAPISRLALRRERLASVWEVAALAGFATAREAQAAARDEFTREWRRPTGRRGVR